MNDDSTTPQKTPNIKFLYLKYPHEREDRETFAIALAELEADGWFVEARIATGLAPINGVLYELRRVNGGAE